MKNNILMTSPGPGESKEQFTARVKRVLESITPLSMPSSTFPRFYIVDGVPVRIVLEGDEVAGYTFMDRPFPPLQAECEGRKVDFDEYQRVSSNLLNN
jgi:hypothetical protein